MRRLLIFFPIPDYILDIKIISCIEKGPVHTGPLPPSHPRFHCLQVPFHPCNFSFSQPSLSRKSVIFVLFSHPAYPQPLAIADFLRELAQSAVADKKYFNHKILLS